MLTCEDIPKRPTSLHRAKRIISICAICINFHMELTAASIFLKIFFHKKVFFITTGRFGKLNPLLGASDQLKTCVIRAWYKQKTWTALLTNFTFGKGESQTANHFFILRFTYEYNFIYISLLFYFTDTKRVKVTTTSKD